MTETGARVLLLRDADAPALAALLERFGLRLRFVPDHQPIPGSYWGEPEAGLVGSDLLARADTPVHSVLHEASHFVCMSRERRQLLSGQSDAGGDDLEESAVCYLQVRLADEAGLVRAALFRDMDAWGYSFRLGSARAWFERDAEDARAWLQRESLIDERERLLWKLSERRVEER